MKIPLTLAQGKVTVTAIIRYKRVFGHVEFFVDTGSDVSFISHTDAFKLKIPGASLPLKRHALIGGGSMALNTMENVSLIFRNEKNEAEKILISEFLVAQNLRKDDKTAQTVPSIIGLDFLSEHKLVLYVNPSANQAYLEEQ